LLLALGQAATLAMVRAGPRVGYQHYVAPWELGTDVAAWALATFAVEVVLVGWGMVGHLQALGAFLRERGGWRTAVVAAVFVMTSATLSLPATRYAAELLFASAVQLVHLGALFLFAASLRDGALTAWSVWTERILGAPSSSDAAEPGAPDRFAWLLALFVTVTAALLAILSYQRHPHVPDEVVYLLQAGYLAAGKMALALPRVAEAFQVDLMTYEATRWFSPVPPGWPFILAIGAWFGVPWLVNPVLGGINVVLAYLVLRELYPRRTARVAILLLAASPWNLFMAMNFMTHTATLTAALVAALAVGRMRRTPGVWWPVLGGIGIGVVGLIRPLEGIALAGVLGLWSLGARGRLLRFGPSAVLTLVSMLVGALVLPYNQYYTGSMREFPIMAYTDAVYGPGRNALGFGANRGLGWPGLDPLPGHGPLDVLINANFNLFQINTELLGWATGSLLLIAMLCLWGRLRRPDWYMLLVMAVVSGVHSFYYFSGGPDFGARYWHLIIIPGLVLSARGLDALGRLVGERDGAPRVMAGSFLLVLVTLLVFVPWRARDKYFHYRGMRPDVRAMAADPALRDGLVLIRGNRHPDYASAVVYNPLTVDSPAPLFTWDRSDTVRAALVAAYPAKKFWLVDGPTVSGDGFRIVAGPMTGAELLASDVPPLPGK
jgi:4-amino-4-deoxy-L-arabinose transferase-like glycosyltransferase